MPIKHTDGADYFSQSEIDEMIKGRLKGAHGQIDELTAKATAAEQLRAQLEEAKAQAAQAQGGLTRYRAAASHGITDDDTLDAFSAAHEKFAKANPGRQLDFGGYLEAGKADPTILPSYLRNAFGQAPATPKVEAVPGGASAPAPVQRPAWSSAVSGQQPVATGQTPSFSDRVGQAKSLDDLVKLQQERSASRRG